MPYKRGLKSVIPGSWITKFLHFPTLPFLKGHSAPLWLQATSSHTVCKHCRLPRFPSPRHVSSPKWTVWNKLLQRALLWVSFILPYDGSLCHLKLHSAVISLHLKVLSDFCARLKFLSFHLWDFILAVILCSFSFAIKWFVPVLHCSGLLSTLA